MAKPLDLYAFEGPVVSTSPSGQKSRGCRVTARYLAVAEAWFDGALSCPALFTAVT